MKPERTSPLFESALRSLGARPDIGPAWLSERRAAAAERLRAEGFPHNRQEAWRFSALRPLLQLPFEPPEERLAPSPVAERVLPARAHRVVLVNGRSPEPISMTAGGAKIMTLGRALGGAEGSIEPHLGRLSAGNGGFAAQNDAMFEDAVVIRAEQMVQVDGPVYVVHAAVSSARPTVSYPRLLVIAEPGSNLTVVEVFVSEAEGAHLQSALAEIVLGEDAHVTHARIQLGRKDAFGIAGIEVEQHRSSRFTSHLFTLGGTLSRVDLRVHLAGEGSECSLDALYAAGSGEQVEHHTRVDHRAPRATSQQLYKGVVAERGEAVFDGTVVVRREASGTVAHQKNRNLVLSEGASVHTKPHLEIDTDDVTCSHGATVGQLDESQVFYLRSRGIDSLAARAMLVDAFAKEMVERIAEPALRDHLRGVLQGSDLLGPKGGDLP